MKYKSILGAAFLSCSCAAHATSGHSLYGLLDIGPNYVSNAGGNSLFEMRSGMVQQSRFGFRGTEDLGGGYEVGFLLESGISVDTGVADGGTAIFSRASVLTFATPVGMLRMGREAASLTDALYRYNATTAVYGPGYMAVHPGDFDRILGRTVNNIVKYVSPVMGGVSIFGSYSPGEQPGSFSTNSMYSAGANYVGGKFSMGVGWFRANGANPSLLAATANPFGITNASDYVTVIGIGASYQFEKVLLHALATQTKSGVSGADSRTFEVGTKIDLTPSWVLGLDANRTIVKGRAGLTTAVASLDYFLSKRTDLYVNVGYETVGGTNINGTPLVAQMVIFAPSSSQSQAAAHVGIRHRF
ncbi:porin [Cupriavidus taiwanensis]|uniref:porin n=1 Tax=Cupriavidus taiwanensis TaxID=164546 RepID=UPI000E14EAAB|nr:porin [Cupriavidus taiwanensis]SOZ29642.1 putative Outer membrane porin protein 32 [Cupriavidus taiwanensis]SPA34461.1 putative Outer membrane porin protein 32 [Cupriavidus taiwanensis]